MLFTRICPIVSGSAVPLLGGAHALPLEPLEDRPGELDVLLDEARGDVAPGGDDGHEGIGRELVEEAGEVHVAHFYHLWECGKMWLVTICTG